MYLIPETETEGAEKGDASLLCTYQPPMRFGSLGVVAQCIMISEHIQSLCFTTFTLTYIWIGKL